MFNKKALFLLAFFFISNAYPEVDYFQPETFEQANPVLSGIAAGQQIYQQQLQNQILQTRLMEERAELAQQQQQQESPYYNQIKIMIFGYDKKLIYLGCLNCPPDNNDSVFNNLSPYGNKLNRESIYNSHTYGSARADFSACNINATHPPLVADNHGKVYGLLTSNLKLRSAIRNPQILSWLKNYVCA